MGSTNTVSRGQLRSNFSSRPPFLVVGLFVILGILGFSYWSLSSQFNDLQKQLQIMQENVRLAGQSKENMDKQNRELQSALNKVKLELETSKLTMSKKEKEREEIEEKLRMKDDEESEYKTQVETLSANLNACQEESRNAEEKAKNFQENLLAVEKAKKELENELQQIMEDIKTRQTEALKKQNEDQANKKIEITDKVDKNPGNPYSLFKDKLKENNLPVEPAEDPDVQPNVIEDEKKQSENGYKNNESGVQINIPENKNIHSGQPDNNRNFSFNSGNNQQPPFKSSQNVLKNKYENLDSKNIMPNNENLKTENHTFRMDQLQNYVAGKYQNQMDKTPENPLSLNKEYLTLKHLQDPNIHPDVIEEEKRQSENGNKEIDQNNESNSI
ncbi:protein casc4-like [Limulus polyphemus]|uniref:Protein casc4-like n=1 Tax=Limulus polyphemus TaxID=6850 RepID=A0ABM1BGT4_LIMPO|nr:protein casc4-like [Limulus polyphemus]